MLLINKIKYKNYIAIYGVNLLPVPLLVAAVVVTTWCWHMAFVLLLNITF